ncbi:hypothetical protein J132_05790 [Termitomyces sp. J132]|nr:hypothetical protein J132_05790 [Termitomyces sp. J132]
MAGPPGSIQYSGWFKLLSDKCLSNAIQVKILGSFLESTRLHHETVQQTMQFALVLTALLTFVSAASLNLEARQSCGDPANASPFFRLYNSGDVDHFYTLDASEGLSATNLGYTSEGVSSHIFPSEQPGSVPLYRLYSPGVTDHFYTIDAAERDSAVKLGYYLEGVAGYIYPNAICGAVPFFRMYSANGGDHFYTTSTPERDSALGIGYADEGIAGYVYL